MENKTLVIGLFGGPSAGKTTISHGLMYALKTNGVICEYIPEFAKEETWKGNLSSLKNQIFILGEQHDRIFHKRNKVDVIVTDSPLPTILTYCDYNVVSHFIADLVIDEFNKDDNLNYFVNRIGPYEKDGRRQSEEQSKELDKDTLAVLNKYCIPYKNVYANETAVPQIMADILTRMAIRKTK